jgi:hypothetical protein
VSEDNLNTHGLSWKRIQQNQSVNGAGNGHLPDLHVDFMHQSRFQTEQTDPSDHFVREVLSK